MSTGASHPGMPGGSAPCSARGLNADRWFSRLGPDLHTEGVISAWVSLHPARTHPTTKASIDKLFSTASLSAC